jgi:hypothetical protein
VAQHQIDHHPYAALVRLFNQGIEVLDGAEQGVDGAVVFHIVPKIFHGRFKERRDPDGGHPERLEVVQSLFDAANVANSIAIGILERPRINLINYPALPPCIQRINGGIGGAAIVGRLWIERHDFFRKPAVYIEGFMTAKRLQASASF